MLVPNLKLFLKKNKQTGQMSFIQGETTVRELGKYSASQAVEHCSQ